MKLLGGYPKDTEKWVFMHDIEQIFKILIYFEGEEVIPPLWEVLPPLTQLLYSPLRTEID